MCNDRHSPVHDLITHVFRTGPPHQIPPVSHLPSHLYTTMAIHPHPTSEAPTRSPVERHLYRSGALAFGMLILAAFPNSMNALGILAFAPLPTFVHHVAVLALHQRAQRQRQRSLRAPRALVLGRPDVLFVRALLALYAAAAALCLYSTVSAFGDLIWISCSVTPQSHDIVCDGLGALVLVLAQDAAVLAEVVVLALMLRSARRAPQLQLDGLEQFDEVDIERGYRPCEACGQVLYVPMAAPTQGAQVRHAAPFPFECHDIDDVDVQTTTDFPATPVEGAHPPPYDQGC